MTDTVLSGSVSKTQTFLNSLQAKYSSIDKMALANKMLKGAINIGEAIVNPLTNTGIAGFKFHIAQTEQVRLENEITDFYTDINSPIQDHIVRKPLTITLSGLVGDYQYSINELKDFISKITPTLELVKQFLPQLSDITKQTIVKKYSNSAIENLSFENLSFENNLSFLDANKEINIDDLTFGATPSTSGYGLNFNAMDLFKTFQDLYKVKSAQTRAYLFFEALAQSQALFSIETTWKRYDNMALLSVIPTRDNNLDVTEFQATFKQLSQTQVQLDIAQNAAGRLKEQASNTINKGINKGQKALI